MGNYGAGKKVTSKKSNTGATVGYDTQEDVGEPFEQKMKRPTPTLWQQQVEAAIAADLKGLGYGG